MCPKALFLYLCNKHRVNNLFEDAVQKSPSARQHGLPSENIVDIYIEVNTRSDGSWQKIRFVHRKCYRYVVTVINV